jgi:hypothetical protein
VGQREIENQGAFKKMPDAFFMYDASRQALVFGTPQGPMAIPVSKLKKQGWIVDEAELRKSLPRYDRSTIEVVPVLPPLPTRRK